MQVSSDSEEVRQDDPTLQPPVTARRPRLGGGGARRAAATLCILAVWRTELKRSVMREHESEIDARWP